MGEFTKDVSNYKVKDLKEKCIKEAVGRWNEVQESTSKVLNGIIQKNAEGISLLVFDMFHHMLVVLSFLNQTPYITFARFISQAKKFPLKPAGFHKLIDIMIKGDYQNLQNLKKVTEKVFTEFEEIFEGINIELYDNNIDPNRSGKE